MAFVVHSAAFLDVNDKVVKVVLHPILYTFYVGFHRRKLKLFCLQVVVKQGYDIGLRQRSFVDVLHQDKCGLFVIVEFLIDGSCDKRHREIAGNHHGNERWNTIPCTVTINFGELFWEAQECLKLLRS